MTAIDNQLQELEDDLHTAKGKFNMYADISYNARFVQKVSNHL